MPNSKEIEAKSNNPVPQGYVLGASEGEHLIHFRDGGNIFIKVDPVKGSNNLGLGTQQLPKGSGIPVHRHLDRDEAFYVLEGSGTVTLNDVPHPCERGGAIFIPKNTWHGFSSLDQELVLLWVLVVWKRIVRKRPRSTIVAGRCVFASDRPIAGQGGYSDARSPFWTQFTAFRWRGWLQSGSACR